MSIELRRTEDLIRECVCRAEECERTAKTTDNLFAQPEFRRMALRWRNMAQLYEFGGGALDYE